MALGPRLDIRQTQALVMTPQLQQAIKLLQMTNLEVSAFVDEQIEQNPLLEREDPEGGTESGSAGDQDHDRAEAASDGDGIAAPDTPEATFDTPEATYDAPEARDLDAPEAPDSVDLTATDTLKDREDTVLDADYENVWDTRSAAEGHAGDPEPSRLSSSPGAANPDSDAFNIDNLASDQVTMRDHLIGQINMDIADPTDRLIATQMVDALDEAGYLTTDLAALAETLGCTLERIEAVLDRVQRLDPPGIFARNLAECLALQLRDRNRLDPAIQALLDNLEMLAKRDFGALQRLCGVDHEDFVEMINEIKALNPKPASVFEHIVAQPVIPDVFVRRRADGGWDIELNNDTLPRVLVNNSYYASLSARTNSKPDRQYLVDCIHSANWLARSLQQRAETILKVATELVDQQSEFFIKGVQYLKPLTLRDIAEEVGVHESTVSRVTNNKYIGAARGIFEMKYFFTSALGQTGPGDAHSSEAVRFKIKALIDKEAPNKVLSDDKIVEILRGDGVEIARRTVAKYREAMRIPSSVQRRREKALTI